MKNRALLTGAAALLALATPSAASAAPVTAPTTVLSTICTDGYIDSRNIAVARGVGGKVQGFVNFKYSGECGDRIFYFEGSGRSWRVEPTALVGKVVSVAADSSGTHLMFIAPGEGDRPGTSELGVVTRTANGSLGDQPIALGTVNDGAPQDGRGSIVAKNGQWFAVWPQYTGTPGQYTLFQAATMFGGGAEPGAFAVGWPNPGVTMGTHPVLTMDPSSGQPQLFWQRGNPGTPQEILHASGAYGAWGEVTTVASGVTISPDFGALDASATASGKFLSWTQRTGAGDRVVVANDLSGAWSTSTPPAEDDFGSWDADIAASGTTVFAAYGSGDGSPDGAFMGSKARNRDWSAGDATEGIPRSIDTFGVAGLIYNGGGKSTALIFSGHRLYAVTR